MRDGIQRRDMLKGLGVAGAAGLAGCFDSPGSNGGGNGGRQLKLGILMGVSGDLAQLGPPIRQAAELAVNQVSDADTEFSVDTQFEDTATDANQGISGAEALVNAGYPMIVGALSSTVTIQTAKNVTIPNEVVQCSPASTSPRITDLQDNNYVWRTPPSDALQGQVQAKVATERHNASTASTMFVNNAYGQALSQQFVQAFEETGGTVQETVSFEKEQGSYTSKLNTALSGNPDVLVIVGYPASGVQIFRDYYADYSDSTTQILVTDGLRDPDLPGDVGNDLSNVQGTAPLAAGPGQEFFTSEYNSAYGEEPGVFTAQSFDAAAVLLLANAAAKENTGKAIRDKMQDVANPQGASVTPKNLASGIEKAANGDEIQYEGASSPVDFDENGDITAATYELFSFEQGGGVKKEDEVEFEA